MFDFLRKIFGGKSSKEKNTQFNPVIDGMMKEIFPNGTTQVNNEISELSKILGVSKSKISAPFVNVCVRAFMREMKKEELIWVVKTREKSLTDEQAEKFAKYVFTKMIKQNAGINDESLINVSLEALGFIEKSKDEASDEIKKGIGEFGICVSNPVPVNGIFANESYLRKLQTSDGLEISWNRIGSTSADNIKDPIDIYEITDSTGKKRPTIYICAYYPKTSTKAPIGYIIKR